MADPFGYSVAMGDDERKRLLRELAGFAEQGGQGFARGPGREAVSVASDAGPISAFAPSGSRKRGPGEDGGAKAALPDDIAAAAGFKLGPTESRQAPLPTAGAGAGQFAPTFSLGDPMIGAGINIRDSEQTQLAKMLAKRQSDLGLIESQIAGNRNQLLGDQITAGREDTAVRRWLGQQASADAAADREQKSQLAQFGADQAIRAMKQDATLRQDFEKLQQKGRMDLAQLHDPKMGLKAETILRLSMLPEEERENAIRNLAGVSGKLDSIFPNALPKGLDPTGRSLPGSPQAASGGLGGVAGPIGAEKGVAGQPGPVAGTPAGIGQAAGIAATPEQDAINRKADEVLKQLRMQFSRETTGTGGKKFELDPAKLSGDALDAGMDQLVQYTTQQGALSPEVKKILAERLQGGALGDPSQLRQALGGRLAVQQLIGGYGQIPRDEQGKAAGTYTVGNPQLGTAFTLKSTPQNFGGRLMTKLGNMWQANDRDVPYDQAVLPTGEVVPIDRGDVYGMRDMFGKSWEARQQEAVRRQPAGMSVFEMLLPKR